MEEKKKEPSMNLSGSMSAEEKVEEAQSSTHIQPAKTIEETIAELSGVDNDQVADIMEQILDLAEYEKELMSADLQPGYLLAADAWLYSISRRSFFKLTAGSEILSIERVDDKKSHCLINSDVFEVSNDLIDCVGWN